MPPDPPKAVTSIPDARDALIRDGANIRHEALSLLRNVRRFRIGLWISLRRSQLTILEGIFDQLFERFLSYENGVSRLLNLMTTLRVSTTPAGQKYGDSLPTSEPPPPGSTQPVGLNLQLTHAIYATGLSSQREALRALLQEIGNTLNSHRSQANTLAAIAIAVASFIVALIGLFL